MILEDKLYAKLSLFWLMHLDLDTPTDSSLSFFLCSAKLPFFTPPTSFLPSLRLRTLLPLYLCTLSLNCGWKLSDFWLVVESDHAPHQAWACCDHAVNSCQHPLLAGVSWLFPVLCKMQVSALLWSVTMSWACEDWVKHKHRES